jgi:N-acetylmuramoyl-L-alanine amidase
MVMRRRDFIGWLGSTFLGLVLAGRAGAATSTLEIICRDAWGAKKRKGDYLKHTIQRLTIHHSGALFTRNREAPARIRSIQAYHQSKGWPDIAYHLIIDRHGNVYRGRPSWAVGNTATDYNPRGHLLVLCLGHFGEQEVPRAMKRALVKVLAEACTEFDVRPSTIRGHGFYASTACPGSNMQALIRDGVLRRAVKRRLGAGGVRKKALCGAAGARRIRAIENGTD